MKKNELIKKFGKEKRWVNYKKETRKGKTTKLPYNIKGKLASSVNPSDWSTYDEAKKVSDQVGIVFTPVQDLLGIDIDHCLIDKKINHEQKELIADLIIEADTYTEISPSGAGLHLFLEVGDGLSLEANKHAPFEAYTSGRYFTFTGECYGKEKPIRKVSHEEALKILSITGYPWKKSDPIPDEGDSAGSEKVDRQKVRIAGVNLTDDQVIAKFFKSKNGDKIKALYEGSLADHKNDASSADMALLSHFAFWTGCDKAQMERLWLASPLGNREKTKTRLDYRNRTLAAAIANCKAVYESREQKLLKISDGIDLDLLYTIQGKDAVKVYAMNMENISRILRRHPRFSGRFRYDAFKTIVEVKDERGNWKRIEDKDILNIQSEISIMFDFFQGVNDKMVENAVKKVSHENIIDSAQDFIRSLVWDGVPRLDEWLMHAYGAPGDLYHRAAGSNWIKGLVKRIMQPGCKFDYVLVLEGPQGVKKSTSLAALVGEEFHLETASSADSKDFFMNFAGKLIIEFSEGETLSKTEVKKLKAIITMQKDTYRVPFARFVQDFPRRSVFAMTTNQEQYLKDDTGNRRWLPVKVEKKEVDLEWIRNNREQLFAEARVRVIDKNEPTWEFPEQETLDIQNSRRIHDPNADLIAGWYYNELTFSKREDGITIHDAYKAIHPEPFPRPINHYETMTIASVLREVLNLDKRRSRDHGDRMNRWYPKGDAYVGPNESHLLKVENEDKLAEEMWNSLPDKK